MIQNKLKYKGITSKKQKLYFINLNKQFYWKKPIKHKVLQINGFNSDNDVLLCLF